MTVYFDDEDDDDDDGMVRSRLWLAQRQLSVDVPIESAVAEWVEHWLFEGKVHGSNPPAANVGSERGSV